MQAILRQPLAIRLVYECRFEYLERKGYIPEIKFTTNYDEKKNNKQSLTDSLLRRMNFVIQDGSVIRYTLIEKARELVERKSLFRCANRPVALSLAVY